VIKSSLMAVSGFADGTAEVLRTDYTRFNRILPNANQNYWDANKSWPNKWKNGDPLQGTKFLGSTTFLVWTTDGYHLTRFIRNATMITAICIPIGGKKNWKQYAIEIGTSYISYTIGFNIAYEIVFKK